MIVSIVSIPKVSFARNVDIPKLVTTRGRILVAHHHEAIICLFTCPNSRQQGMNWPLSECEATVDYMCGVSTAMNWGPNVRTSNAPNDSLCRRRRACYYLTIIHIEVSFCPKLKKIRLTRKMAESFGIVAGAVGIAAPFTACVDCFQYIQVERHFGPDFQTDLLSLDCTRLRLTRWRSKACHRLGYRSMLIQLQR